MCKVVETRVFLSKLNLLYVANKLFMHTEFAHESVKKNQTEELLDLNNKVNRLPCQNYKVDCIINNHY